MFKKEETLFLLPNKIKKKNIIVAITNVQWLNYISKIIWKIDLIVTSNYLCMFTHYYEEKTQIIQ